MRLYICKHLFIEYDLKYKTIQQFNPHFFLNQRLQVLLKSSIIPLIHLIQLIQ